MFELSSVPFGVDVFHYNYSQRKSTSSLTDKSSSKYAYNRSIFYFTWPLLGYVEYPVSTTSLPKVDCTSVDKHL